MERKRSGEYCGSRVPSGAAVMRAEVTDALTRAFFCEWARSGYSGLSLERVARQAGVGKAALYRRWTDKAAMATDLIVREGLSITDTDAGESLEEDLLHILLALRRALRHPLIRRIITDLHAEIGRTPSLAQAIRPFQQARRARVDALIDRAVSRGELSPDLDRTIAADLIAAPIYWRIAVTGGRSDRTHVERLAKMLSGALRTCGS